jgi:hypothetical protein
MMTTRNEVEEPQQQDQNLFHFSFENDEERAEELGGKYKRVDGGVTCHDRVVIVYLES